MLKRRPDKFKDIDCCVNTIATAFEVSVKLLLFMMQHITLFIEKGYNGMFFSPDHSLSLGNVI